ncbi:MAG: glycosyltransferase family 4 protein [Dehalococcoidia bacterium]|nr:MAG: glycosyltransferase family 4 protein [Dehalococcoidia bacterium]
MKICFLGIATSPHIERQAVWFAGRGHEVHVITFVDTKIKDVNIHYINMKLRYLPFGRISSLPLNIGRVKKTIKEIDPDIVNGQYLTNYGLYAACSGFHPLVLTAWGSDVLIEPKRFPFIKLLIKYSLKKGDVIICPSPAMEDEIIKLGANPGKIKFSFFGVDTGEFSPPHRSEGLRQRLGISDAPAVISTRGLSPIYDVETLIKAIPLVLKEVPPAKFIVAGEGKQRNYLESLSRRLGVSDSVKFVGLIPHNEISQYLASSDVYVSTSLSDGVPNSLLEAMASGLAPVLTDIAANRLWIKDEENGFLVRVKDCEILASRITRLLKDNKLRSKFGEMNRRLAKEKAEHKIQMEELEKVYQGLLGQGEKAKGVS